MNAQASLSSSHIERVAEELLAVDTADMRFLAVYFEEEFPLYELRYTFAYSFSRPRTFAEDDAVVGITNKRKSAPFKFTVEFRQHYVAQYGTERSALRHALRRLLILVSDNYSCVDDVILHRRANRDICRIQVILPPRSSLSFRQEPLRPLSGSLSRHISPA